VADNRTVKRSIKTLQKITTWQLAIILLLMLFVSATFLRLNNIGMAQRREAVKAADKQGDSTNLQNRVLDLQHYVAAHMNTDGNAVYLEQQYARDKAQILQKAAQSNTATDVINKKVDDICKPQFSGYTQGYVQCFAREYAKYAPGTDPISSVKGPDPDKYRIVFVAPLWSPDFAGFSVLACIVILLVIIIRLISLLVLKLLLKRHYQSI
jgi:hypothetical protein